MTADESTPLDVISAPVAAPGFDALYQAEDAPLPRTPWVDGSADGVDWGWESVDDSVGIAPGLGAWVELAVGDGFVLARVETYEVYDGPESEVLETEDCSVVTSGSEAFEPSDPRGFIAQVPA